MQRHHDNVVVACLSAEELHTPPGCLQDKLHLLKINQMTKIKYQEHFWKLPEILGNKEKSHLGCAAGFSSKNRMQKESTHLDL